MASRSPWTLAREALAALDGGRSVRVARVSADAATSPGLYAMYATAASWGDLGLDPPPDERPLYVGKAESTLAARDLQGHFGMRERGVQSPTGSSTVRRSLAALLSPARGFRGMPRNPAKPGYFSNYGLSPEQDEDLSGWMRRRLRLSVWPHRPATQLDDVETIVLRQMLPPLNLDKIVTPWQAQVKVARKRLADEARAWSMGDRRK